MRRAFVGAVLAVATGCESDPGGTLQVALQRFDRAQQCWETVEVDAADAKLDAGELGLPEFCPSVAAPALHGGEDRLRVVTAYRDIEFSNGAMIAQPAIALRLEGIAQTTAFEHEQRLSDHQLVVLSSFDAPPRAAAELALAISAAADLEASIPVAKGRISLIAPKLALVDLGCAIADPCKLAGGVGTTPVDITLPSTVAGDATLTWTLDGIPQPESRPVTLVRRGDVVTGRDFVPVPASNKTWQLAARFGGLEAVGRAIQLVSPALTAELVGCGTTCSVAHATKRTVRVVAPRGIRSAVATLSTYVDGVPGLVDITFNLSIEDLAADTVEGSRELDVPDAPDGSWQIEVRVAGFRAPSITATIGS